MRNQAAGRTESSVAATAASGGAGRHRSTSAEGLTNRENRPQRPHPHTSGQSDEPAVSKGRCVRKPSLLAAFAAADRPPTMMTDSVMRRDCAGVSFSGEPKRTAGVTLPRASSPWSPKGAKRQGHSCYVRDPEHRLLATVARVDLGRHEPYRMREATKRGCSESMEQTAESVEGAEQLQMPPLVTRIRSDLPERVGALPRLTLDSEDYYHLLVVDRHLASISEALRISRSINPVNSDEVRAAYVQSDPPPREAPPYRYRSLGFDPEHMSASLHSVFIEDSEIGRLLRHKRNDLSNQLNMLAVRGSHEFVDRSRLIYGTSSAAEVEEVQEWLDLDPGQPEPEPWNATQARQKLLEACQQMGVPCIVRVSQYLSSDAAAGENSVALNKGRMFSRNEVLALACHEIGTHILRNRNGERQPFRSLFYHGFPRHPDARANYLQTEEGLATFTEEMEGLLTNRRKRILAGRVLAVYRMDTEGIGFFDLFQSLVHDHRFTRQDAYTICERVFRGGGYTKDHIYMRGYRQVKELWSRDPSRLGLLFAGKVGIADLDFVLRLYRTGQGILYPPRYLPAFVERGLGELSWDEMLSTLHLEADPAAAV